jgi:hypothetical protein
MEGKRYWYTQYAENCILLLEVDAVLKSYF